MIVDLAVPFADSGETDLRLVWGQPAIPILDTLEIAQWTPGTHLSLRLLGASHQAILTTPEGDYAETLACLPNLGQTPPRHAQTTIGRWTYTFTYHTTTLATSQFSQRCRQLRENAQNNHHALLGQFPGHKDAITCLTATTDPQPGWSTVHAYPETGTWVTTSTTMAPTHPAALAQH